MGGLQGPRRADDIGDPNAAPVHVPHGPAGHAMERRYLVEVREGPYIGIGHDDRPRDQASD